MSKRVGWGIVGVAVLLALLGWIGWRGNSPLLPGARPSEVRLGVSLPGITAKSPWAFRCNLGSDDEALAMAAYRGTTTLRRIAVAYINDEFGVGAVKVFREAAGKKGITLSAEEAYDKDATDFRTLA